MAAFNNFSDPFIRLNELGVLDSLLPFVLIFTVIYAVLQKTKIIGEGKKQFNVSIALIMALMVVIPHITGQYPPGQDIVSIMNSALPQISLIVVAILAALLIIGVFAPGIMFAGTGIGGILALVSMGAVAYIFGNAAGIWKAPGFLNFLSDPDTQAVLIIILVFGLVVWLITKDEGDGDATKRIMDGFKGLWGGGH
jgi:hypothetical protein